MRISELWPGERPLDHQSSASAAQLCSFYFLILPVERQKGHTTEQGETEDVPLLGRMPWVLQERQFRAGFALSGCVLGGKTASTVLPQGSVLGQGCSPVAESSSSTRKA